MLYTVQQLADLSQGLKGRKAAAGIKGAPGFDVSQRGELKHGRCYRLCCMQGAKGSKGRYGEKGQTGFKGETGDGGGTGDKGGEGSKGVIGNTGPPGGKGDRGDDVSCVPTHECVVMIV